jgi:hypothetical protein
MVMIITLLFSYLLIIILTVIICRTICLLLLYCLCTNCYHTYDCLRYICSYGIMFYCLVFLYVLLIMDSWLLFVPYLYILSCYALLWISLCSYSRMVVSCSHCIYCCVLLLIVNIRMFVLYF